MKKILILVAFALLQGEVIEAAVKINAPSDKLAAQWFEELVPMTDGVKLYTVGVAPANAKKCPIVIIRTPYVKEQRTDMVAWEKLRHVYVSRGYACVFQHCRGCGMSEGDWVPYEYERADGLALLDFVRKLPWYNGEIFLLGASYSSSVHFSYLDTDSPDVKGASLIVQDCNRYNICYRNGFFKIGLTGNWFVKGYKKKNLSLKRDKSVTFRQFPLADFTMRYWGVDEPSFDNVLLHPREDDPFWNFVGTDPSAGAVEKVSLG